MLVPVHFEGQRFGLVSPSRETGLRPTLQSNGNGSTEFERVVLNSFDLGEAETQLIARALEVTEGNRTRAAELLGLSVRTLRNRLNAAESGKREKQGGGSTRTALRERIENRGSKKADLEGGSKTTDENCIGRAAGAPDFLFGPAHLTPLFYDRRSVMSF